MSQGAWHFVWWAMTHGYHCWSELHYYFADHTRGAWREWICMYPENGG